MSGTDGGKYESEANRAEMGFRTNSECGTVFAPNLKAAFCPCGTWGDGSSSLGSWVSFDGSQPDLLPNSSHTFPISRAVVEMPHGVMESNTTCILDSFLLTNVSSGFAGEQQGIIHDQFAHHVHSIEGLLGMVYNVAFVLGNFPWAQEMWKAAHLWLSMEAGALRMSCRIVWNLWVDSAYGAWNSKISCMVLAIVCMTSLLLTCTIWDFFAGTKRKSKRLVFVCRRRKSVRKIAACTLTKPSRWFIGYLLLWDHCGVLAGNAWSTNRPEETFDSDARDLDLWDTFLPATRPPKTFVFEMWIHKAEWADTFVSRKKVMYMDPHKGHTSQIEKQWKEEIDWGSFEIVKVEYESFPQETRGFVGDKYIAFPSRRPDHVPLMIFLNGIDKYKTGTVWVQQSEGSISSADVFDILTPEHQCETSQLCTLYGDDETLWPNSLAVRPGLYIYAKQIALVPGGSPCSLASCSTFDGTIPGDHENQASRRDYEGSENESITLFQSQLSAGSLPQRVREQSYELQRRIQATHDQDWERWEQERQIANRDAQITGQLEIQDEIDALRRHQHGRIKVYMYGLLQQQVGVEELYVDVEELSDFLDLLVLVRRAWIQRVPVFLFHIAYVNPQIPPFLLGDSDGVSLICDFAPTDPGLPVAVVSSTSFPGDETTYDVSVHRAEQLMDKNAILRMTGFTLLCASTARCICSTVGREITWIPIRTFPGMRLDVSIEFQSGWCVESFSESRGANHSDRHVRNASDASEDQVLMQTTLRGGATVEWLYAYLLYGTEPIRAWEGGRGEREHARYLAELYRLQRPNLFAREMKALDVRPQPDDLVEQRIKGYVLAANEDLKVWQVLVLVDLVWLTSSTDSTGTMPPQEDLWRAAKTVDYQIDLRSLYEQLGLAIFCEDRAACITWIRGFEWNDEARVVRVIDGDYIKIRISSSRKDIPLGTQWELAQAGCTLAEMGDRLGPSSSARASTATSTTTRGLNMTDTLEVLSLQSQDENSLMQRPIPDLWTFTYLEGEVEPLAEHLSDYEVLDPIATLRQRFAQRVFWVRPEQLLFFAIRPQPPDLSATRTTGFLHTLAEQIPSGKSLVLLDVEFYGNRRPQWRAKPTPSNEWREVRFVEHIATREAFLREVGLRTFCYGKGTTCFVTLRDSMWNIQDHMAKEIYPGDYIIVKVKANEERPIKDQWQKANGICEDLPRREYQQALLDYEGNRHGAGSEDEYMDTDNTSLLQVAFPTLRRSSAAEHAKERLPPPGNGKKAVSFNPEVQFSDVQSPLLDHSVSNPFIRAFCETRQEDFENPFTKDMLSEMRFEKKESHEGETKPEVRKTISIDESLSDTYLPIREEPQQKQRGVSFKKVRVLLEWLDRHMTLPDYETTGIPWKEETKPWIELPIFAGNFADEYHFYTDRSKTNGVSASAVVLFCKWQGNWYYGGHVKNTNKGLPTSFTAELKALAIAFKWTWDICKVQGLPMHSVKFHYHYDAQAAGRVAFGTQNCIGHDALCYVVRGLFCFVREVFQCSMEGHYVPGHTQDPGNEAADSVANLAATTLEASNTFWNAMLDIADYKLFAWLWFLQRSDVQPYFDDDVFSVPKPVAVFDEKVAKSLRPLVREGSGVPQDFVLNLLTLNTLSVNGKNEGMNFDMGPTKLDALCYQMHGMGVQIFALQETRIKHKLGQHELYTFLQVEADKKGHGGLLLAISTQLAYTTRQDGSEVFFKDADLRLLSKTSTYLIAKLTTDFGPFVVACVHTPHSGKPDEQLETWWSAFASDLRCNAKNGSLILLGDFNSRVGETPSDGIDVLGAEVENLNGMHLRQLLIEADCFLPATYDQFHEGPSATWKHPGGAESRLDYVALPAEWKGHQLCSRVLHEIAVSTCLHDHSAALVCCTGRMQCRRGEFERQNLRRVCPDILSTMDDKLTYLYNMGQAVESTDWALDVHQHTAALYNTLQRAAKKQIPTQTWVRKSYLTPEAWDAICRKRKARKIYYQLSYANKIANLKEIFEAWSKRQVMPVEHGWVKKKHQELAWAEQEFRLSNLEANRLNRRDDKRFYEGLVQKMTDNDEPALQNRFWKTIRRLLPKYRQRRSTMNSAKLASLDEEWLPHLCQGEALEMEDIYKRCIEAHNRIPQGNPDLEDLPDLVAVEKALRKSQPGRAPGSDGLQASWMHYGAHLLAPACFDLYVKSALWNTEPVHFKGGAVTMLEKTPGVREVSKFRSIVLMGILAKRLHALGREKLIRVLDDKRTEGQIGGFAHQEVMFGSLAMRMFTRAAHAEGRPTATMFFDLTAAYHGLVRQGVVGGEEMDLAAMRTLAKTLTNEGQNASVVLEVLDRPGILQQMGATESLINQLTEYHTNTWTCIKGDAAMTHRGSRPGSPLADAMFLTEMAGILQDTTEFLKAFHSCQVAWADDLAICVRSHTNEELESCIREIIRFVNEQFTKRGMRLNFAKGKTEIIVSNRGEGAGEKRRQFLQMGRPAIDVEMHDGKVVPVLCVGTYKHLGSWMECGGLLGTEVEEWPSLGVLFKCSEDPC